ncbi:MAG: sulfoxide reductase heme-binding subunit YedZ [Polyangiaceae bacterium]|nr:sulfoxide reductase heme-binding subunit YedZ [Polyangiaceae bacterium]
MSAVAPPAAAPAKLRASKPLPWLVPGVVAGALVPLAAILFRAATGGLGANPVAEALNQLGLSALILLIASLVCSPLKSIFGWTWPIRVRKTLGLASFFYASLHVLTYVGLDQVLDWKAILLDVTERKFIAVGFLAFLLLIPLAVTSTSGMLKRLGFKRWKRLHRLAYVAAVLGVIHFVWRVKIDLTEPSIYGAVLAVLLAIRLLPERASKRRPAGPPT